MNLLIGELFSNAARAVPHRVAAALGDASLTFGELDQRANQTARALARLGVGHRERVVVWSATTLDTVPLFAALAKLGAVFAPINAALSTGEATETTGSSDPTLLVADTPRIEAAADVANHVKIPLARLSGLAGPGSPTAGPGADLAALARREDVADLNVPTLRETDPHVVFFTSGSTGQPKGAVLSHRVNLLRTHPGALLEPRGAMVCPYPLFHMGAWTIALQQWQARDRVVLVESADAVTICDAIEQHRATRLNCIPAVWRRILDHLTTPEGAGRDMSSVRFADTGTSATPLELLEAIETALPQACVRVFYGSTEAGGVATLEHADVHRKPGSCGQPAPFTEVRVEADGELCTRGPLLFDGYLNNPAATAAAIVDGWYRTGDLAEVDDEGYLTIVGRARDVVRTGGETVAPAEVEAVLARHPALVDVAVVGLPDAQWGEVLCAVVVSAPDRAAPTLDDLRSHCAADLAPFKHPRRVVVVDAIPRTASTSQVQRRLLVERLSGDQPRSRKVTGDDARAR